MTDDHAQCDDDAHRGGDARSDDSGDRRSASDDRTDAATRTATIRSSVDAPETVVAAISPDDTEEMTTTVDDGHVVTAIERDSTGSLEATVDDYVVALDVATTVVHHANRQVQNADRHHDTQP